MTRIVFTLALFCLAFASIAQKKKADLLVYNAKIYTIDKNFSVAQAMVISNGKVAATGTTKAMLSKYNATEKLDAKGCTIYPGFIDAHAHFLNYGLSLQAANLVATTSWEDVLARLVRFAKTKNISQGAWITGRGWDQNDWPVKEFPTKERLDELFPHNPVYLTRVDGHAAIVNSLALQQAGVTSVTTIEGGDVELKKGEPTGLLIDKAMGLVAQQIPPASNTQLTQALMDAQQNCFAVGLTTVDDCGVSYSSALLFDSLHKSGVLKMRLYAMLSDDPKNFEWAEKNGKIKTPYLNVQSFKVYADGALGSRGACLLQPYHDRPDWTGFLLYQPGHFDSVAKLLHQMNWQMNTHAIGDSGNRTILRIYAKNLGGKNDRRWRIEHAQVVDKNDFAWFGKHSIIPSVQPTHATSDMYWAEKRLGPGRVKGAYAFKDLMKQNGWIPLGTDFPVEDISPFKTFYAAVFRRDDQNFPEGGFQMENALTRMETLKGMTIWAAQSNFEEKEKGSLESGKLADFIILDQDLMKATPKEVLETKVLATYVNGKKVYGK